MALQVDQGLVTIEDDIAGLAEEDVHRSLLAVDLFRSLPDDALAWLEGRLERVVVQRGVSIIREGDDAEALFIPLSGRFSVHVEGRKRPIAEVGPGRPIGEVAFFASSKRTATVTALRDCVVLRLSRSDFDTLTKRSPEILQPIAATLARRLARATSGEFSRPPAIPRSIVLCRAGPSQIPDAFIQELKTSLTGHGDIRFLTGRDFAEALPQGTAVDSDAATNWLNEQESRHDLLVYLTDETLTDWTQKAIRQADWLLYVAMRQASESQDRVPLNKLESFAAEYHAPEACRLVMYHERPDQPGNAKRWLQERQVHLSHHVIAGSRPSFDRLSRFITGNALGLVACGGGALCCAHVGLFKAFREAGIEFDIFGGTSGGGAMTAAFAFGVEADELDKRIGEMFVKQRVLRRLTWPRYALLDHKSFDNALLKHYTNIGIEDLHRPFFALSTNLSTNDVFLHQQGSLWQAVRSTGSIPGLLPPFVTEAGDVLVDGAVMDNVPVKAMKMLKTGPNIVVSFADTDNLTYDVRYSGLPSRAEILMRTVNPLSRNPLPRAPSVATVLMRSLMVNRSELEDSLSPDDLLVVPPIPDTVGVMDWHRHTELKELAYLYGRELVATLNDAGHPVMKAALGE